MRAVRNELLAEGRDVPLVKLCRWLGVPRSTAYYLPRERRRRREDLAMRFLIYEVIQTYPMYGIRKVWAQLRFRLGISVNNLNP